MLMLLLAAKTSEVGHVVGEKYFCEETTDLVNECESDSARSPSELPSLRACSSKSGLLEVIEHNLNHQYRCMGHSKLCTNISSIAVGMYYGGESKD